MTTTERSYWAALAHCESFSLTMWQKALAVFPSAETIWRASQRDLETSGITPLVAAQLVALRATIHPETLLESLDRQGICAITIEDDHYPLLLKQIYDPPFVLFVRGTLLPTEPVAGLAVVGTRKISAYGQTVLPPIVSHLARNGITILSGLALGIDGVAHETTLAAGGRTVAVVGAGVDTNNIYPPHHRGLAERIVAAGGAVISEYAPNTRPATHHFPARNRIVSGMSHGVLVCDCPEKSGALITASFALEHGRELFAIPGPINHVNAAGPNTLIKNGAIPVTSPHDILDVLHLSTIKNAPEPEAQQLPLPHAPVTPQEEKIVIALGSDPLHIDALVQSTGLTSDVIASTLVIMELNGRVRHVGYGRYVRA